MCINSRFIFKKYNGVVKQILFISVKYFKICIRKNIMRPCFFCFSPFRKIYQVYQSIKPQQKQIQHCFHILLFIQASSYFLKNLRVPSTSSQLDTSFIRYMLAVDLAILILISAIMEESNTVIFRAF